MVQDYGMVWHGMIWYGVVQYMVWCGTVRYGVIVREAEVILPTFSRDKSILLLNCPLHA